MIWVYDLFYHEPTLAHGGFSTTFRHRGSDTVEYLYANQNHDVFVQPLALHDNAAGQGAGGQPAKADGVAPCHPPCGFRLRRRHRREAALPRPDAAGADAREGAGDALPGHRHRLEPRRTLRHPEAGEVRAAGREAHGEPRTPAAVHRERLREGQRRRVAHQCHGLRPDHPPGNDHQRIRLLFHHPARGPAPAAPLLPGVRGTRGDHRPHGRPPHERRPAGAQQPGRGGRHGRHELAPAQHADGQAHLLAEGHQDRIFAAFVARRGEDGAAHQRRGRGSGACQRPLRARRQQRREPFSARRHAALPDQPHDGPLLLVQRRRGEERRLLQERLPGPLRRPSVERDGCAHGRRRPATLPRQLPHRTARRQPSARRAHPAGQDQLQLRHAPLVARPAHDAHLRHRQPLERRLQAPPQLQLPRPQRQDRPCLQRPFEAFAQHLLGPRLSPDEE